MAKNIVLNIPHSSVSGIFDEKLGKWICNPHFINDCVNKWTDWWTDMLFTIPDMANIERVVFPYSRFVCDAERLKDDVMEEKGQGIIYTHFGGYKRGVLSEDAKAFLLGEWEKHKKDLSRHIGEETVLIDCHSFPSELANVDICIGFNDDWSYNEKLVTETVSLFERSGFSVGLNEPFSNSITPVSEHRYASFMIEVNKRVYMDEKRMQLVSNSHQWMRWYDCLKRIYENILGQ
ncbi:MAG: N-formylglutamate amidohydrolase [Muribaculaceae bacterium]